MARDGDTVREGGDSAREDGDTARKGRTLADVVYASPAAGDAAREGGGTVREGGGTVREGGSTVREGGSPVREGASPVRDGGSPVREGQRTPPAPAVPSQEGQVAGWLPPVLAADWRIVKSLPARGAEADLYVLRSLDPEVETPRVAKVYREQMEPKEDVLSRVREADPAHVVRLEDYGMDAGRHWELMEYVERGSLRQLLEQEGPKLPPDLVRDVLRQLNDALVFLHGLPLEHRDLKPGNVLVRSRTPLDLILTDFGISSVMDATMRYTGMGRTIRYAPPEAIGSAVQDKDGFSNIQVGIHRTKWDYWSLGMMLVEMLEGEHPFDGPEEGVIANELLTRDLEELTEGITDPDWRKLCRGLLRRIPAQRWDAEAVSKWLDDPRDRGLEVAKEAAPAVAAAEAPATATIDFDGASYATPAELGAALAGDWVKAESFWKRRFEDVRTWVTDGLGLQPLGDALAAIDDGDLPLESQVFSFVYLLAPEAPLRFRDVDISMEGLPALGERAADKGERKAREVLLKLYRQRIPMLAGALPGRERHAEVSRRWDEAVLEYERLQSRLPPGARGTGEVPGLSDDVLVVLLAGAIRSPAVLASLREEARKASTKDARKCPWFRELGEPEQMRVAVLVIVPSLQAPAEQETRDFRRRPFRGCVGGIVVGGLFGRWVRWVHGRGGDFELDGFEDVIDVGGGVLLLVVVFAAFIAALDFYVDPSMRSGRMSRGFGAAARGAAGAARRARRGGGSPGSRARSR